MHHFTPWRALGGGVLLGVAASLLWLSTGRVAGVSGILADLFSGRSDERRWRALFLAGLVAGGLVLRILAPSAFAAAERGLPLVAIAGLLVGFGARLGGGCTSGHGICGLSRLSLRSLIAVGVFMATGLLTVAVVGGSR
jgi:uncharacterized membrane protein YedE/YeeE